MLLSLLLKATLIGFSIAMPVGPIGLLCVRNSIVWGRRYGFATGMGAAIADTFYGALAGFGVAALTSMLMSYKLVLQIIGGLFLCYLGLMTLRRKPVREGGEIVRSSLFRVFLMTFFLTLTNPMTILSFIGIYAALGIGLDGNSLQEALMLTGGVFLGSSLWWLILSTGSALLRDKLSSSGSNWFNRISGSILIGFGITALFV